MRIKIIAELLPMKTNKDLPCYILWITPCQLVQWKFISHFVWTSLFLKLSKEVLSFLTSTKKMILA
jgi:hypothetical protein